ncbi:UDP-N-acetylglucosamine 2-epimerase [Chloroflexota bacterium]
MKIIFLVDNIPAVEMFLPIIKALLGNWEVLIVNYDGWTRRKRIEIENFIQKLALRYKTIGKRNRHGVEEILQEEQPDVVVLARDEATYLEQLFIELANSRHIPTLLVPHGIWAPGERKPWCIRGVFSRARHLYRLGFQGYRVIREGNFSWVRLIGAALFRMTRDLRSRPLLAGHGGCSRIAAFGEAMKELLISEGLSPERITVTGNPKFDLLYNAKKGGHESEMRKSLGIKKDENIVLLLTDYLVEFGAWTAAQRKNFIMAICEAVAQLPVCKLVIKIHPVNETEADYLRITKDLPNPPLVCKDVPLPELINACNVAITVMSTAGLEVMAMGKPLLAVNFFDDVTPFDESSGVTVVHSESDLLAPLELALRSGLSKEKKEAADKYVSRQAYVQDGKAASRIADLILEMTA